ncbi:presqualene diphosphate synthase HpnD [Limibacillus halophilus]|jgi:squalene synthase HpnD
MRPETPNSRVERIVRDSGSSFFWGMRLLPKAEREAMFALYAYCRRLDDIADGPLPMEEKLAALQRWRLEVAALYGGQPETDIGRELQGALARFALPRQELEALIDGMEQDLRERLVAPPMSLLQSYCRKVAGSVGLISLSIFGSGDPTEETLGPLLGEALQFTNILRDLREDALRGRLYLPEELLARAGVESREPLEALADPRLSAACELLAEAAAARFAESRRLIAVQGRQLKAAALMLAVYERLLRRLRRAGWPAAQRVRLPAWEKAWLVFRYGVLA